MNVLGRYQHCYECEARRLIEIETTTGRVLAFIIPSECKHKDQCGAELRDGLPVVHSTSTATLHTIDT
jgi:hypothetical protein